MYLTNEAIARNVDGLEIDYPGAVELARAGHPASIRSFRAAAEALGKVIATLANSIDPEKIILTGDGLAVWELASADVRAAIDKTLIPGPEPLDLDVQPFQFNEWARAAAVVGIRTILRF